MNTIVRSTQLKTSFNKCWLYLLLLTGCLVNFTGCNTVGDHHGEFFVEQSGMGQSATLMIKRRKQAYLGIIAKLNVYINEQDAGTIANGETKSFIFKPLQSGHNTIRIEAMGAEWMGALERLDPKIKERVAKELEFECNDGQTVSFYCNYDTDVSLKQVENEVIQKFIIR